MVEVNYKEDCEKLAEILIKERIGFTNKKKLSKAICMLSELKKKEYIVMEFVNEILEKQ